MSNIPISSLPGANPLTGEETVPIVQAGTTKRTTTGNISALPFGSAAGSVSGISFVTVGSFTAALPSSRILSATSPVLLTDSGAGAPITISLAFTPGTGTVTSVGLSGGATGITVSGSPITTNGTMTLGGVLVVSNGGIGTSTVATGSIMIGKGTSPVSTIANATTGFVLTSNGPAAAPTFQANAAVGTVTSVALAAPTLGLTVSGSPITSNGTLTLSGFLNGTAIATTSITATQIATNTITFAKIQQIAGLSVAGVAGVSTANIAAITGTAKTLLGVNAAGTGLVFGQLPSFSFNPTFTSITSGTATFNVATSPAPLFLIVDLYGAGGGGGGGSGTATAGASGTIGTNTTFSVATANGGGAGVGGGQGGNVGNGAAGGAGGAATGGFQNLPGFRGIASVPGITSFASTGGSGGGWGGGASGAVSAGGPGAANSGGGGGGGGGGVAVGAGAGGGSGGWVRLLITSPAASYSYGIGLGGVGGAPGGTGNTFGTGGNGADGLIIVGQFFS